jgi:hypothetical protein
MCKAWAVFLGLALVLSLESIGGFGRETESNVLLCLGIAFL